MLSCARIGHRPAGQRAARLSTSTSLLSSMVQVGRVVIVSQSRADQAVSPFLLLRLYIVPLLVYTCIAAPIPLCGCSTTSGHVKVLRGESREKAFVAIEAHRRETTGGAAARRLSSLSNGAPLVASLSCSCPALPSMSWAPPHHSSVCPHRQSERRSRWTAETCRLGALDCVCARETRAANSCV